MSIVSKDVLKYNLSANLTFVIMPLGIKAYDVVPEFGKVVVFLEVVRDGLHGEDYLGLNLHQKEHIA